MARATGYTCDREGCGTFVSTTDGKLPSGWMTLTVHAANDLRPGTFELCSNKCVRLLASEREKAERELGQERPAAAEVHLYSGTGPTGYPREAVGHRTQHVAKGIVNPDCEFCQAETAPR